MKKNIILITSALAASSAFAADIWNAGHGDVGIAYEDNELELTWHLAEETGDQAFINFDSNSITNQEFAPDALDAYLNKSAETVSLALGTALPNFSTGDSIFIAPQDQPDLLNVIWPGIGAEEVPENVFVGNTLTLTFTSFSASNGGSFALWEVGTGLGASPTAFLAGNGTVVDSLFDTLDVTAGTHSHYNWGFSGEGKYDLGFTVSGELVGGGTVTSEEGIYTFIVPEPSTYALLAGAAGLAFAMIRRRAHKA